MNFRTSSNSCQINRNHIRIPQFFSLNASTEKCKKRIIILTSDMERYSITAPYGGIIVLNQINGGIQNGLERQTDA